MYCHVSQLISDLASMGVNQTQIADSTKIPQYQVSRLFTGQIKHPRWSDVKAIEELHKFVVIQEREIADFNINDVSNREAALA